MCSQINKNIIRIYFCKKKREVPISRIVKKILSLFEFVKINVKFFER